MKLPAKVTVCETGPTRLRHLTEFVPTEQKLQLIWALAATGVTEIEASAFVNPRYVPHLADAEAVFAELPRRPGLRYVCYTPNLTGARRALAAGADEIRAVLSLSDTYGRQLVGMTAQESLAEIGQIAALVRRAAPSVRLTAHLGCAFGCAYEGAVPLERVVAFAKAYADLGLDGAILYDNHLVADPVTVYRVSSAVREAAPGLELGLRLHDSHGFGLTNLLAGLQAGITRFDGSIGGIGGEAFKPGWRGTLATEAAVALCHAMGVETGIDMPALHLAAGRARELAGRA